MLEKLKLYVTRVGVFLIPVALVVGMAGCDGCTPSQNLEIRDWYDLDAVRNNLGGHHILMNDIDSNTRGYAEMASPTANGRKGWQPIGWGYWAWTPFGDKVLGEIFKGTFDGQGYEIRDLFINRSGWGGSGIFGCVGKGGIIRNIGVTNATMTVPADVVRSLDVAPIDAVGIVVGFSMGSVSGSYASGAVSGDWSVGGLVGQNTGTVNNCYSTANVTGTWAVGGLVGSNGDLKYGGTVSNCYSTGNITGDEYVGGLVGKNEGSTPGVNFRGSVRKSFWDIETSGQATSDGGKGKTTGEMKDIATFSDAGWNMIAVANPGTRDPSYIWNIVDGVTYPFLSWQAV